MCSLKLCVVTAVISYLASQANACLSGDPNNPFGTTSTLAPTTPIATQPTTVLTTPIPTTTVNPYDAACKAVGADFGNGDVGQYSLDKFQMYDGNRRLHNKDTGVPGAAAGRPKYLGVVLKPGEKATLTSAPVSFTENKNLLVKYYEATDGIVLKGCSNDESNCQDISNLGIKTTDLNWRSGNYPITTATNKVLLVAENKGTNLGAVGIDKIGLSDQPDGPDHCAGSSGPSGV